MAKVYSWVISDIEKKYAYIVHPNDYNKVYIGAELKGVHLEKIAQWTSNCSDEEYIAQFEKMKELCKNKGYNIEFENVEAYMNVFSTCDNLRGPEGTAGRGIENISLTNTDPITNIDTYTINYNDGSTATFSIKNGRDGTNGRDGKDGAKGDMGISSKIIMVYASGKNADGMNYTPERPQGGKYDFISNKMTYPLGWEPNDEGLKAPIYMSSRTFASNDATTDPEWTIPVQITGENGAPGADGVSTEFIYKLTTTKPTEDEILNLESKNESGFIPSYWTGSPCGVTEDNPTEWCCTRKLNKDENNIPQWGPWQGPTIWSQFGINGQDGDGVQYIYLRNRGELPLNPTPTDYTTYEEYQSKENEWVPPIEVAYTNIYGESIYLTPVEDNANPGNYGYVWSDNPFDVNSQYQYQWVCSRKYTIGNNGTKIWQAYSNPSLWGKFGEDGKNATSIRKLYALSTSTSNPPTPPTDSVITGDWGTGFPKDYISGENVVWGTEAEIWANNNELVKKYVLVSTKDADGNVIPPSDATSLNTKTDVTILPNTEVEGYKYILYNEGYYEWKGTWCEPYLVTGLKGENGNPVDYTTYVYAYGWTDARPARPNGTTPDAPGTSIDERGRTIIWEDFPNTDNGRVDGMKDENGDEKRWYQCIGHVYGHNQTIKEWGNITPCSGRDGESLPGKYTEFRFGVTENDTKPSIIQFDSDGNVYREPKLYDSNGNITGWFSSDNELPDIPENGAMWQIWAIIDGANNTVLGNNGTYWNGPIKISGEKGPAGERGETGPAGMRGVSGIPGSSFNQMYCLGTYDVYFGSDDWKNTENDYGSLPSDIAEWYTSENMPYSDFIDVTTESDLENETSNKDNCGRVIRYIENEKTEVSGSTFYTTTHTYYLVKSDNSRELIKGPVSNSEEFNVCIWCIQGTDVWNIEETEESDASQYTKAGVKWTKPFRLQGTNGLRGLTGNRGQVVYPMGQYNNEEVYLTTSTKAPYVYDSNDGQYYVYNTPNTPWVGILPSNFDKITNEDGTYKYSLDGTYGNWIKDKNGDTPSNNYANAVANNQEPAWVRFESFNALYTSIGIIENGMIGSAVYNNEFMFSQQGINKEGMPCNYTETSSGFLSGYDYDKTGDENGRHWKYKGTDIYIDNIGVNPYEVIEENYIHDFMPNICINFSTGQMWTSCGKTQFNYDGSGYLLDRTITWGSNSEGNPFFQIGNYLGSDSIRLEDSTLTIGPLNEVKEEIDTDINSLCETLGYKDISEMADSTKANGKIIMEGGYLNADLIDADAILVGRLDTKKDEIGNKITISGNTMEVVNDSGITGVHIFNENVSKYVDVSSIRRENVYDNVRQNDKNLLALQFTGVQTATTTTSTFFKINSSNCTIKYDIGFMENGSQIKITACDFFLYNAPTTQEVNILSSEINAGWWEIRKDLVKIEVLKDDNIINALYGTTSTSATIGGKKTILFNNILDNLEKGYYSLKLTVLNNAILCKQLSPNDTGMTLNVAQRPMCLFSCLSYEYNRNMDNLVCIGNDGIIIYNEKGYFYSNKNVIEMTIGDYGWCVKEGGLYYKNGNWEKWTPNTGEEINNLTTQIETLNTQYAQLEQKLNSLTDIVNSYNSSD